MKPFTTYLRVRHYEMDAIGHVNNAVYQHYLEQATIEHSEHLGFTIDRCQELGGVFVLRRVEIEYLRPALAGDTLAVTTWIQEVRGSCAIRHYEIHKREDHDLLITAEALWVWVDVKTRRPRAIPTPFLEEFSELTGVHA
ncbi:MAG: acyl-CoA thioesterase [Cyanobacteria bacterium CRU_2_1]|nr:acyl-CoA thioesterase [Cyanobacteria bacterium RU_5_0]NJR58893.1 acyl-CoA thioesterase [Cyanobacteria bacterium CRU_2_1]